MTQMTFFDSPAFDSPAFGSSAPTSTPLATPTAKSTAKPLAAKNPVSASSVEPLSVNDPSPDGLGDGVQHMGDLARLVLLRYQLVAKRRAEMTARRPR